MTTANSQGKTSQTTAPTFALQAEKVQPYHVHFRDVIVLMSRAQHQVRLSHIECDAPAETGRLATLKQVMYNLMKADPSQQVSRVSVSDLARNIAGETDRGKVDSFLHELYRKALAIVHNMMRQVDGDRQVGSSETSLPAGLGDVSDTKAAALSPSPGSIYTTTYLLTCGWRLLLPDQLRPEATACESARL